MNRQAFEDSLHTIIDAKSPFNERFDAISFIHREIQAEVAQGFQRAGLIHDRVNKLADVAHSAIHDEDFAEYYCRFFKVKSLFFSLLTERESRCAKIDESIYQALTRNAGLQNETSIISGFKALLNNGAISQAIRLFDWVISSPMASESEKYSVLHRLIAKALQGQNPDILEFLHSSEHALVHQMDIRSRPYSHMAFETAMSLYEQNLVVLGELMASNSHCMARIGDLTRYESVTGEAITPEIAITRSYSYNVILSYLIENPEKIESFRGAELKPSLVTDYRFKAMIRVEPKTKRKHYLNAAVLLAKQWRGTISELGFLLEIICAARPENPEKYLKDVFREQAKRHYQSLTDLVSLIDLFSIHQVNVELDYKDKALKASIKGWLENQSLKGLRELLMIDQRMKVIKREHIIQAIENNWDQWTEKERESLKSMAAPCIVEGAKPLRRFRLERDMGI